MAHSPNRVTQALLQSFTEAPQLLGDLPEAAAFPCHTLVRPHDAMTLNFEQKLGHLYEDALAAMLAATPRYTAVARGIQIRKNTGHTVGELDFLIRDLDSDQTIHLELAVKFYLAVETERGFLLPGPDARDNYFRKLTKMRSHQLVLTDKYDSLLPERFRQEKIIVQQLVHGCIFSHIHARGPAEAEFLNPNGRRGKWLRAEQCARYFGKDAQLKIIPKPLWPVPLKTIERAGIKLEKWIPDTQMDRCVMVRAQAEHTAETMPFFITPNRYPLHVCTNSVKTKSC